MKRIIMFSLLFLLLGGCAVVSREVGGQTTPSSCVAAEQDCNALEIIQGYTTWSKVFAEPRNISAQLMLMCRMAVEAELKYLDSEHAKYFVQVYVNTPDALAAMKQAGTRVFPEGTVIVKEKWAQDAQFHLDVSKRTPAGLGIMVKQPKGFDTAGGDWKYLYVDEAGKITSDQAQLGHCRACHMGNEEHDAVFYPEVMSE